MDSRVKDLALAIVARALDAVPENKADVFVSWAPHVSWLSCEIFPGGWVDSDEPEYKEPERVTVSLDGELARDTDDVLQELSRLSLRVHEVIEAGKQ